MPKQIYRVTLSADEREQTRTLHAERATRNPQSDSRPHLAQAAEGWDGHAIADALTVGRATVERPPPALR